MDTLSEINQILLEGGHKVNHRWCEGNYVLRCQTVHHNILSISIYLRDNINIILYIYVDPLNIQVYTNKGYCMYSYIGKPTCGRKDFQSFEDLLDELQDLELISCGYNIKGGNNNFST